MSKKLPGYETVFITRVDQTEDQLKALKDRVLGVIKAYEGEVVYQEDWGKRKLSYAIAKETRGHYTYLVYTGKGDVVAEIERNLRLNEFVMRFLTINLAKEFDHAAYTKEFGAGTALKRDDRLPGQDGPLPAGAAAPVTTQQPQA